MVIMDFLNSFLDTIRYKIKAEWTFVPFVYHPRTHDDWSRLLNPNRGRCFPHSYIRRNCPECVADIFDQSIMYGNVYFQTYSFGAVLLDGKDITPEPLVPLGVLHVATSPRDPDFVAAKSYLQREKNDL